MEMTTQVFVLLFALIHPGTEEIRQGVAFPKSMAECNKVASIIINDFKLLREAESTMLPKDIAPRIKLGAIMCLERSVPLSGLFTENTDNYIN